MTSSGPIVRTAAGRVRGIWRDGSAAFRGIPFAAPPVGELRFDAPRRHAPWSDVRDAVDNGPTPQRRPFGPVTTIPEPSIPGASTLNVNVFTPAPSDRSARLPVLVWIHGGGFFAGSPASPWYDGASFNRDGVVTVSISYRLGFDGFGWIADAPSNRGLLDQIAALEWVQENVEEFGGDPAKVTIAGQSAGGGAVLALLGILGAQPLFTAAISQSGVVLHRSLTEARAAGTEFAAHMGVAPTRRGWAALTEDEILDGAADLAAAPGTDVAAADAAVALARSVVQGGAGAGLTFMPHLDDELVRERTLESIAGGIGGAKPLLLGATAHEFTDAVVSVRTALAGHDPETLLTAAGVHPSPAAVLRRQFCHFDNAFLLGQLITEYTFRRPLLDVVEARQQGGGSAGTWLYDFRWESPIGGLAAHCLELPFVWDLLDAEGVAAVLGPTPPESLAAATHGSWVRFVGEGDPGWDPCADGRRPGVVFDAESTVSPDPYRFEAEMRAAAE